MKHGIESLRSLARWVAATAARGETAGVIDSLEVALTLTLTLTFTLTFTLTLTLTLT